MYESASSAQHSLPASLAPDVRHVFRRPTPALNTRFRHSRRSTLAPAYTARRGKDQFKIRDLFADECCSQPILSFLSAADVGRLAPAPTEEDDRVRRRSGNSRSGGRGKRRGG